MTSSTGCCSALRPSPTGSHPKRATTYGSRSPSSVRSPSVGCCCASSWPTSRYDAGTLGMDSTGGLDCYVVRDRLIRVGRSGLRGERVAERGLRNRIRSAAVGITLGEAHGARNGDPIEPDRPRDHSSIDRRSCETRHHGRTCGSAPACRVRFVWRSIADLAHNRWLTPGIWRLQRGDERLVLKWLSADRSSGDTAWLPWRELHDQPTRDTGARKPSKRRTCSASEGGHLSSA